MEFTLNIPALERAAVQIDKSVADIQNLLSELTTANRELTASSWKGESASDFAQRNEEWAADFKIYIGNLSVVRDILNKILPMAKDLNKKAAFFAVIFGGGASGAENMLSLSRNESAEARKLCKKAIDEYTGYLQDLQELKRLSSSLEYSKITIYAEINAMLAEVQENQNKLGKFITALSAYEEGIDKLEREVCRWESNLLRLKGWDEYSPEYIKMLEDLGVEGIESLADANTMDAILAAVLGINVTSCEYNSDPVNMATGNFVYEKELLKINGLYPLSFKMFYNSLEERVNSLGHGWVHNFEVSVKKQKNKLTIFHEDGRQEIFLRGESGEYHQSQGVFSRVYEKDGNLIYQTRNGTKYTFNETGKLIRKEDADSNYAELIYDKNEKLIKVENNSKAVFHFSYKYCKLVKVKDDTGRAISFEYKQDTLICVTDEAGAVYRFAYNAEKKLNKIINPLGIENLKNEYDGKHRVLRQIFPDGGIITHRHTDEENSLCMTEQNGNEVTYLHDDRYRSTAAISSQGTEKYEYNEQDQRTSYTDKNGNMYRCSYDENGNLTKITNPLKETIEMEYGICDKPSEIKVCGETLRWIAYENGKPAIIIDALKRRTEIDYNANGKPLKVRLPDASEINIAYDERGNIRSITRQDSTVKYSYDKLNRVTVITDGNGNKTKYEYNNRGDITKVINAEGRECMYHYNANHKLIKLSDFDSSVTTYSYNATGRLEEVTNPSGAAMRFIYDLMWNVIGVTDPCGNTVRYGYDKDRRVTLVVDKEGSSTNYEYDPNGNVTAVISSTGAQTEIKYDALGRQSMITEPDGVEFSFEYDVLGNVTKITGPRSDEIKRTYDKAGQLTSTTDQMGGITSYSYTNLGKIETITNAAGETLTYSYYPGGRLKSVTRPGGESKHFEYDKNGNITKTTDGLGGVTAMTYDCLNRIRTITNPLGHRRDFSYDALGNATSITDENGNTTLYNYSPVGELIEVIDAMGHSTKYGYDKSSRLIRMEQCQNIDDAFVDLKYTQMQVTSWDRNNRGEVTRKITPTGDEVEYKYDQPGNLISITDEDGYETLYDYDLVNKLKKVSYADGRTIDFGYNDLRQLTMLKDWLGTIKFEVDPLGRVMKTTDHDGNEVGYTRDALGRRTSIVYPDGYKVEYGYNKSGRLKSVASVAGMTIYKYDEMGRMVERTMPGGIVTKYETDLLGRLESLSHQTSGEILDRFEYSYDPAGNITQIDKRRKDMDVDSGVFSYYYDPLDRLTGTVSGQSSKQYRYDSLGNRVMCVNNGARTRHNYNSRNQLVKTTEGDAVKEYSYDARGNLTKIFENGSLTSSFTFDAANRMVEAETDKGNAVYEYNGLFKRVSKLETFHNPETALPEVQREVRYTHDLTKHYNDLLAIEDQRFIWGRELLMSDGENPFFCLSDHLGSPIRLLSNTQEDTFAYDDFGVPAVEPGTNFQNPFGFTGYQSDNVSQMQYAGARYYAPEHGRFTSEDTVHSGINWYIYCSGNPLRYVDRNGLWGKAVHYDDTKEWAIEHGFSDEEAELLAYYDYYTDNPASGIDPFGKIAGSESNQSHHFNRNQSGEDSRRLHADERFESAVNKWNEAERLIAEAGNYQASDGRMQPIGNQLIQQAFSLQVEALRDLGHGLHALQDIEAHGQITANDGRYNPFGHAPYTVLNYISLPMYLWGPFGNPDDKYRDWIDDDHTLLGPRGREPGLRYQTTMLESIKYLEDFNAATGRSSGECTGREY